MSRSRVRYLRPDRLKRHEAGIAALDAIWGVVTTPTKLKRGRRRRKVVLRYGR